VQLVRGQPASFAAFDVLAVAGRDTRHLKLRDRRSLLEELARTWSPPLNLSSVRKPWWSAYRSTVSCE
jgi:ATP-dependent DNA ligase